MSDERPVTVVRVDDVLNGRYHLTRKLGEGGMGSVYLARDRELDRDVAVKLLAMSLVNDAEVVERFEREARLAAKLDHPNVVAVYDVGRHQGRPFMVMKALEGQTLAQLLRDKGGLTPAETLALLRQVASGLGHIHQRGFIHRDIKASNIFVSPQGQATILDFGILRSSRAADGLTKTGAVMGTPHYMSPEQALGAKDLDHRADLYALAVVLFECLTGTLPFEADSELRLIQLQAHEPPPDLIARAPWVSPGIAAVVRRAMAKRPLDRFASADELIAALELAVSEAAMAQKPASYQGPQAQSTALGWRRRGEVASSPIVDDAPPAPAGERTPTRRRLPWVLATTSIVAGLAVAVWLRSWPQPQMPSVPTAADDGGAAASSTVPDASLAAAADEPTDAGAGLTAAAVPPADAGRIAAASARAGQLSVLSMHAGEPFWAQVYLNGLEKGRTPLQLTLAPGRYDLRVERTGFRPEQREIMVAPGKSTVVRIDLSL